MGVASLVLGIISIVFAGFGFGVNWLGLIVGVVGIVLAVLARKQPEAQAQKGVVTAGLVCSIVGAALALVLYAACYGTLACAYCTTAGVLSGLY